ncbi:MAG TPA: endolytic transglycosylase MltG [Clostridiaceae bacterium]|nr:endolytic transglycosylase MltG [Clostridiaceae bacterium]
MHKKEGKSYRKKNKAIIRLIIFLVLIALTIVCGMISYKFVLDIQTSSELINIEPIDPEVGTKVEIPLGSNTAEIANLLKEKGIITNTNLFRFFSKINGYDGTYQSGVHVIEKGKIYTSLKDLETLMRILSSRPLDNPSIKVTIREGLTLNQLAELLAEKGLVNKEKFLSIAENETFDYKFLKGITRKQKRLQGYLFPETYIFDTKAGEKAIINKLLGQFDKIFKPEYYKRAEDLGMTVDEVIILASIIEREVKVPEERETIAGVFYNRLRSKDKNLRKLQSCATIQYILLERDGKVKETLTLEDEQIESPFNTYLYEGLPPAPICSPGRDSILAALNPEQHEYYYFVQRNDGSGGHYFSKTYKEHLNNKAKAEKNSQSNKAE